MQKHRKHVKRWPKFAAMAAAGASFLGWLIAAPAAAFEPNPEPVCGPNHCTWQFDVAADAFLWQVPPGTAEVWIDVQGASTGGADPLHWKGQLPATDLALQIEHLPNGLISMRGYMNALGEFVYAAPGGWNQSWVDPNAFARVDQLPAVFDADGFVSVTTVMAPRVVSFDLQTGTSDVSAFGHIQFSEPITGLDSSDFAIWAPPTGCRFENILPVNPAEYTFEMKGCAAGQVAVNLGPYSVQGLLRGPLEWTFGPTVEINPAAEVATVAPVPTSTASPIATASPTPTASPTSEPSATSSPVASTIPEPTETTPAIALPNTSEPPPNTMIESQAEVLVAPIQDAENQPVEETVVEVIEEAAAAPETSPIVHVFTQPAQKPETASEEKLTESQHTKPTNASPLTESLLDPTREPTNDLFNTVATSAIAACGAALAAVGVAKGARRILRPKRIAGFS